MANGADAVYFGVEAFNARLRAENFRLEELPDVIEWLHQRGVQGFLTLNVLIFTDEVPAAAGLLEAAAAAGVDGVIVQDVGLMRLARRLTPDLPVHASTQLSVTSVAGIAQAAELGCCRVVLARELALQDLGRLQIQLRERGLVMPLEVFVHGALCVSYSGQCLTSEALGQRSANRGECAQACRLPYELIVDGEVRPLGEQRYLLSPQDLSAWDLLPQLAAIGVSSLKIEGRLKDASYVAAVTQAYRTGLDQLALVDPGEQAALRRQLELSFSRGLSTGWLEGINHRKLVHGRWSKKRGPWVGRLASVDRRAGWLVLRHGAAELKLGDGVVFEAQESNPLQAPRELGGRVMAVERRPGGALAIRLGPGRLDWLALGPGSPCWLTSDPALESQLQRLAARESPMATTALDVHVKGRLGEPLILRLEEVSGMKGGPWSVCSEAVLERAHGAGGLDRWVLQRQLGRLGGTPWHLGSMSLDLNDSLFLPVAQLNRMRRQLLDQLATAQQETAAGEVSTAPMKVRTGSYRLSVITTLMPHPPGSSAAGLEPGEAALTVLVRSLEQLEALLDEPIDRVVADLEHPHELRRAVELGRGRWSGGVWLAGPRICRPNEAWTLDPLRRAEPDGFLVRNADQLEALTPLAPCIGDFSLNVSNPLSAAWFLERWGLERITASYDLSLQQLLDLVAGCPPGRVEVTLHQHMPLFHMEHCLFCAFLSNGHDHTDCGRPCEQHKLVLRDRSGMEHPLRADLGCRNTLFNGKAQTAAEAIPALLDAGVSQFRVELLDESTASSQRRIQLYREALAGRLSGRAVWQREQLESRLGVTRGTLRGSESSGCVNILPSAP